jgi:hypothetical protein
MRGVVTALPRVEGSGEGTVMLGADRADGGPSDATILAFPVVRTARGRSGIARRDRARAAGRVAGTLAACVALVALVAADGGARDAAALRDAPGSAFVQECALVYDAAACRCATRSGLLAPLAPADGTAASTRADPRRRELAGRAIAACVNPEPVGD